MTLDQHDVPAYSKRQLKAAVTTAIVTELNRMILAVRHTCACGDCKAAVAGILAARHQEMNAAGPRSGAPAARDEPAGREAVPYRDTPAYRDEVVRRCATLEDRNEELERLARDIDQAVTAERQRVLAQLAKFRDAAPLIGNGYPADYVAWTHVLSVLGKSILNGQDPIAEAVTAERERIFGILGRDHHVIFTEDRWTVEHSAECRLSGRMHECAVHAAISGWADEEPCPLGRWRVISADGPVPVLERASLIGDPS